MTDVDIELAELVKIAPLPDGWSAPQLFMQPVDVVGCTLHAVGLDARRSDGQQVCGSAADLDSAPVRRAYFELLERAATLDALTLAADEYRVLDERGAVLGISNAETIFPRAPQGSAWRYARSNGIALQATWRAACMAARLELVERDCVLRSWYGGPRPNPELLREIGVPREIESVYDIEAYSFSPAQTKRNELGLPEPAVAGVFAFPQVCGVPLAYGFSGRSTLVAALRDSLRECLQVLAFLWGEPLSESEPSVSSEPTFHQDYYLCPQHHDRLRAWLHGEHVRQGVRVKAPIRGPTGFVDLTPPRLRPRVRVAKALPDGELPLTFGPGHPLVFGALPYELAVHPIA